MEQHYLIPESIFIRIKNYVDGCVFWRDVSDGLIEIKTSSKSLQEFLSKIE